VYACVLACAPDARVTTAGVVSTVVGHVLRRHASTRVESESVRTARRQQYARQCLCVCCAHLSRACRRAARQCGDRVARSVRVDCRRIHCRMKLRVLHKLTERLTVLARRRSSSARLDSRRALTSCSCAILPQRRPATRHDGTASGCVHRRRHLQQQQRRAPPTVAWRTRPHAARTRRVCCSRSTTAARPSTLPRESACGATICRDCR
jgi:hypothetical protein